MIFVSTTTRRSVVRVVALAAVVSVGIAATSSTSAAMRDTVMRHLKLVKSFPAADTMLTKSPDAIRLWLTEPTEPAASKIALTTEAGAVIPTAALTRDTTKGAPVVASIAKPLAGGGYKVTWKAMSKDGHVVDGTFAFKVGAPK